MANEPPLIEKLNHISGQIDCAHDRIKFLESALRNIHRVTMARRERPAYVNLSHTQADWNAIQGYCEEAGCRSPSPQARVNMPDGVYSAEVKP